MGLVGERASSDDGPIVWTKKQARHFMEILLHQGAVLSVCVSPGGKRIISGSDDRTIKMWDIETGACIRTLEGHSGEVNSVCVSPCGKRIISGSSDSTIKMWDVETGDLIRTLEGHNFAVTSVCVSPCGKWLVSGGGGYDEDDSFSELFVWNLASGECLRTLEGHSREVTSVCVSPCGKSLFSGSSDASIVEWDVTQIGQQALPARVWEQYDLDSADKKSRTGTDAFLWARVQALLQDEAHAGLLIEGNTAKPNHRPIMHQAAVDGHDDFLREFLPKCPASAVATDQKRTDQKSRSCLWHAVNENSEKAAEAICEFWASNLLKKKEQVARVDPARQKEPHLGDLIDISELQALGEKYPKIFRDFIRLVEPVAAYAFVPGSTTTSEFDEDSESSHILKSTDLRSPPGIWDDQAPKGTVPASSCLLPIANLLEPAFLRACILCCEKLNEATVFESPLCRYVVQQKWDEFGHFVYNVETAVYLALMVDNVVLVIALKDGRAGMALAAGAVSVALATLFLLREFAQFYCGVRYAAGRGGSESAVRHDAKNQQQRGLLSRLQEGLRHSHLSTHLSDVWNWLVLVAHVSVFAGSLLAILQPGSPTTRVVVGSSQLPLYLNFLWYGRARKGIGQLIRMVFVIVVDIQFLLYIIALVIVAFTLCFYLTLDVPSGRDELTPDWVDNDYDGYSFFHSLFYLPSLLKMNYPSVFLHPSLPLCFTEN
jgi:hypothetical protein